MEHPLYIAEYPKKTDYSETALIDVKYDYERIVRCPRCNESVSGAYWLPPREVVLTKRKCPDFLYLYCTDAPFVVSENVINLIRQHGLTGIMNAEKIDKARFQRKASKQIPIPDYYNIELAYSKITIDHARSKIHYGPPSETRTACPLCRPVPTTYDFVRSLSFHMEEYEGYDIFHTYELGFVFLSQRVVDCCKENGLTNLHYTPAEKYGRSIAEYFLDGVDSSDQEE